MTTSVYPINKGINKCIEFKGLKAQYIAWLGAGLVGLLVLFAAMYLFGVNTFICIGVTLVLGTALFIQIYKLSHKYGQHGMMKAMAKRGIPHVVKCDSRKVFLKLRR